ncbi:MAG: sulfotransferase [Planctomycetes bacterium]|nr:sulfotransferase [Planctomycetota bacterium]
MSRHPGLREDPVFLCGASRSGTTLAAALVEQLLGCRMTPETHYFDDLRVRLRPTLGRALGAADFEHAEAEFMALSHLPYGHGGQAGAGWLQAGDLDGELGGRQASLDQVFQAYLALDARRSGQPWGGEKTPRHLFRIGDILEVFPGARLLVMVRDPRAVVASYSAWSRSTMGDDPHAAQASVEAERRRVAHSFHPVTAALLWRAAWNAALRARRALGPTRVRIQSFERLVAEHEYELQSLARWLGIEGRPDDARIPVTNSSFEPNDPLAGPQNAAIDRWRSLLTPAEVRAVEQAAGGALRAAGYEPAARGGHLGAARLWATFAPAVVRAARRNAGRSGSLPGYVLRRARLALARG